MQKKAASLKRNHSDAFEKASFSIDGCPLGPRTSLFTAYIETDFVSFISGKSIWIRCTFKEWSEELLIYLWKKAKNSKWENYNTIKYRIY